MNYELSNKKMNEYKAIVLAEAAKDAKTKAESIAHGLGKKLGNLVSIDVFEYSYYPYPLYKKPTEYSETSENKQKKLS